MANSTKKGVKYSFSGQYYTGSKDTNEQIKDYTLDVIFPEVNEKALSLFKTSLLKENGTLFKMMIAKYPDFKRVRTYAITNVVDLSGNETQQSSIATMNMKQLAGYIKKHGISIDVKVYEDDITRLRNAIIRAEEDPEGFKTVYKLDVEAYEFNKSLSDMNELPQNDTESGEKFDNKESTPSEEKAEEGGVDAANLLGDLDGNGD